MTKMGCWVQAIVYMCLPNFEALHEIGCAHVCVCAVQDCICMCVLFVLTGDFEHNSLSVANGRTGLDPTKESTMANCPTIQLNLFQENILTILITLIQMNSLLGMVYILAKPVL